jgi:hypothetical protein
MLRWGSLRPSIAYAAAADLVLVPLKLSDGDMLEAIKTMALVKSTSAMMRREIPARLVSDRVQSAHQFERDFSHR